ncbi:comG operon protein 2 [Fictibacillus macauensis ZFHKF-1]|uniref:ComG operon protein 2 n=1 Tax=Fictibacillus macauensis ZFHKF-1 TaxID=1196324 RepID=I8UCI9_9BACL|nr:competence type IV pilus assembly protein ComGB [Fictibacillus macauensis]EIT84488.1 comG operon protein 2 [Fictibacillus macauensis ZFHKF-1]
MKRPSGMTKKRQGNFLLKLGHLLQQGYSLPKAITVLQLHQERWMQQALERIFLHLKQGFSLHEALHEEKFSSEVLGFLQLAEKHGDLSYSIMESGKMLHKKEEMKERLLKSVRYPIFLFFVVLSVSFIMFKLLIPHFASLYTSLNIDFPAFTLGVLTLLKHAPFLFGLFIGSIIVTLIVYSFVFKRLTPFGRIAVLMRMPLIKRIVPLFLTQQFSMQLGSLLKGGLAINDALHILEHNQYMKFFRLEAERMKQELINGRKFEEIVAQRRYFAPELAMVIIHGQSYGMLGKELLSYSELLMKYVEERLAKYIVFVQPILFLCIGVVILIMFISMLLPMFKMMESIR